jgi:hypothetical protein
MEDFGLTLIAGGRGPARLPTCERALRHARIKAKEGDKFQPVEGASAIIVRVLSFFGRGEMRELRVEDPTVFRLVLSMIQARSDDDTPTSQMAQAVDSLRVIELVSGSLVCNDQYAAAIIERCAATVTELKGLLPGHLLSGSWGHPPVLARCTRLQVLTEAFSYAPAVWLGLSQLHTLHGVNLGRVSMAAIAAALPRLHTLHACGSMKDRDGTAVAGFFTDLLPRLRVLHFVGTWPMEDAEPVVVAPTPPPLPQLKELVWDERSAQPQVLSRFLGARPTVLHAPFDLIAECLPGRGGAEGELASSSFLTRVRKLRVFQGPFDLSDVARILRAAPQLRTLRTDRVLLSDRSPPATPLDLPFMGLVHPHLRCLAVSTRVPSPRNDGCATQLRRTCFPRLREMRVDDETYFVTPDVTGPTPNGRTVETKASDALVTSQTTLEGLGFMSSFLCIQYISSH